MKSSRKNLSFCLYALGLCLSVLRILPFSTHLNGKDSFSMAGISHSAIEKGSFLFVQDFLGYVGLTGPSYPLAAISLNSTLSLMVGSNIELTILYYTFYTFVLCYTSVFIIGYKLNKSIFGAFFTAILFMMSPSILQYLGNWNYSTRTLLLTMLPVFVLFLMKFIETKRSIFFNIFFFLFLFSFSIHRSSYFSLYLFLSLVLVFLFNRYRNNQTNQYFIKNKDRIFIGSLFLIFILYIIPIIVGRIIYFEGGMEVTNPSFSIIDSSNPLAIFFNIAANYAMAFGILIIFLPIGYYSLLVHSFRNNFNLCLIFFFFFASQLWVELVYALLYIMLFIAITSAKGIIYFNTLLKRKLGSSSLSNISLFSLVVIIQFLPLIIVVDNSRSEAIDNLGVYTDEEVKEISYLSNSVSENTIDLSNYLSTEPEEIKMFSNYYAVEIQIRTFANLGQRHHIYDLQSYESYDTNIDFDKLTSLLLGKDVAITEKQGPEYPLIHYSIFYNDNPSNVYFSKSLEYHLGGDGRYYVVIITSSSDRDTWNPKESIFLVDLDNNNYNVYANSNYNIRYYRV